MGNNEQENYLDLFLMDGWKQFQEDLLNKHTGVIEAMTNADSADEFFRLKGNLEVLRWMLNFEGIQRTVGTEAEDDSDADL